MEKTQRGCRSLFVACYVFLLFQVSSLFATNDIFVVNKNRFTQRHKPVVIMGTNDKYAEPTAASITSLKGSTSGDKSVIVLYNELSDKNMKLLESLSDSHTKVITHLIDKKIQQQAQEFSTDWDILVQERLFYPEIVDKINQDSEFLEEIGVDHVRYFLHLDSDTLVLRDLFSILGHVPEKWICFASANLHTVSIHALEKYTKNGTNNLVGVSGGVVVWDLDALDREEQKPSMVAQSEAAYNYLYNNKIIFSMYKILAEKKRSDLAEKIQLIRTEPEKLNDIIKQSKENTRDISEFFENFSKIKGLLENAEKLGASSSEEFWEYLYFLATDEEEINRIVRCVDFKKEKKDFNPTEESVMTRFPNAFVPEKYNFVMKNIFPEIDNTDKDELETWPVDSYTTLLKQLLGAKSSDTEGTVEDILVKNFNNMVVMHFDVCKKPWSSEFRELAKNNSELQKIFDIYNIFKDGIYGQDSVESLNHRALEILKTIDPKKELQKVKEGRSSAQKLN